ncbi:hypothetical protein [Haliovirga abyssi]|uniref:BIG2 domain-containing protein n=1 Tax=Haliovirga abyssi TaxID=2996794 RepID=A0AAU9E0S8_9FUSO|nr:hypothetical protein [Haliovirga abyssi]BDU49950.1 hypothetical protein HLVA_05190 [Haliovirga abyssi]
MKKLKFYKIVFIFIFLLLLGGCFVVSEYVHLEGIAVFPNEKIVMQKGDTLKLSVNQICNGELSGSYSSDSGVASTVEAGANNVELVGDILKTKKNGIVKMKFAYNDREDYCDVPDITIKDNIYISKNMLKLKKMPKKIFSRNRSIYIIDDEDFNLKMKEYNENLDVISEENLDTGYSNLFFDEDSMQYVYEKGVLKNKKTGEELELSDKGGISFYSKSKNNNYLFYIDSIRDKIGVIDLKNMKKVTEINFDYDYCNNLLNIYIEKDMFYLIYKNDELAENIVILEKYNYNGEKVKSTSYFIDKLIEKISDYIYDTDVYDEEGLMLRGDENNLYLGYNTEILKYPGGDILTIDKNSLKVKSHKHIDGYFINKFELVGNTIAILGKTIKERVRLAGKDYRDVLICYDKNSYNMKFIKTITKEKIELFTDNRYLYLLSSNLDDYNCEIEQMEIY